MIKYNEQSTTMVLLPQETWENVTTTLIELKDYIKEKKRNELNNQWIESAEARKLLKVSSKTWQTYRDERRIPFSQFGRKIYVKRADLEAFMQEHYITARHQKGGMA
ncbi:helix-turn-helix domain-containing protein [Bacteroides nordii]|uniref:helix-turn-helix domain-containing protein n=1 Tax=Bacteroides nordii TaxID=291645 RepID=UPI0035205C2A